MMEYLALPHWLFFGGMALVLFGLIGIFFRHPADSLPDEQFETRGDDAQAALPEPTPPRTVN